MRGVRTLIYTSSLVFFICLGMLSCESYDKKRDALPDNKYKGIIYVSADESFKPVIDEQVRVYESYYPGAKISVSYKPEAECLKDMFVDSIRMVITTRGCTEEERLFIADTFRIGPESMVIARDAVAVIVNPLAGDSLFTMNEVRAILKGRFKKNLIPVFDGVKATSTVRFIIDSVLRGDTLTASAVAARTSKGVIDYVALNPGAVGFIGVSWIGNPEDTSQLSFLKKVTIASLESAYDTGTYIKAYQENIYTKRYPMVRDLVYTMRENYKGLGNAFADFMSGEIGQLIFKRAYLVPEHKQFIIRPVRLAK